MDNTQDHPAALAQPTVEELLDLYLKKLMEVRGNDDIVCPICSTDDWGIAQIGEIRMYELGRVSTQVFAVVPVICKTCGYAMFFGASALGVGPVRPAETTESSDSEAER